MRTGQYSVSTTAVKLFDQSGSSRICNIHVETTPIFIGDRNVTSSTGLKLDANQKIVLTISGGTEIWGVTASSTAPVYVMEN